MLRGWQRPCGLRFSKQHYSFMARDKKNNNLVEFMVGDITESRYEEACRFMIKHFLPHEPKIVARNSQNDPLVIDDYFENYMHGIKKKVSIACYKKGSKEFIGVNILEVLGRNDPISSFQPKSKTCRDVINTRNYILNKCDIFNCHQVDYYLSGIGLAVHADYTGRGIAMEMIKARMSMLGFLGLKLSSSLFSAVGSQKAALKAGYTVDCSISYSDLAEVNSDWDFCGTDTKSYVLMSKKRA